MKSRLKVPMELVHAIVEQPVIAPVQAVKLSEVVEAMGNGVHLGLRIRFPSGMTTADCGLERLDGGAVRSLFFDDLDFLKNILSLN